ncbi:MAG: response regulator [Deltaproteobacteria bacterium]|nr:response regulator [Deltaproteobacteria bacterium]
MGDQGTVLVIDDDRMNTQLLGDVCAVSGWRVLVAEDGQQGMTLARKHHPDVILLDLMMPRLDGFGVLAELRQSAGLADVAVVIVSAIGEQDSVDRAHALGAVGYLHKPFGLEDLRSALKSAVSKKNELTPEAGGWPGSQRDEVLRMLMRQGERAASRNTTVGLLTVGLSRRGGEGVTEEESTWLNDEVLSLVRRPQWLYRIGAGLVAVVIAGVTSTYVIRLSYQIHRSLKQGLMSYRGAPNVHVGCLVRHGLRSADAEEVLEKALAALEEARSTDTDVFVTT